MAGGSICLLFFLEYITNILPVETNVSCYVQHIAYFDA